ncbi:MAG: hypothetical protein AB8B51_01235 [Sedimentitalea sp.]
MPIFGILNMIFGTDMPQTKPKYMLIEHDRYFYQRKVPVALQPAVGRKKWRAPKGNNFDDAYDNLRKIKLEHDRLILNLADPDLFQKGKTETRREMECCHARGLKTDAEEYWEEVACGIESGEWERVPEWEHAEGWIEAVETKRANPENRVLHDFPMDDDAYHDLLKGVLESCFKNGDLPPSNSDQRDQYDTAKMIFERKTARVA